MMKNSKIVIKLINQFPVGYRICNTMKRGRKRHKCMPLSSFLSLLSFYIFFITALMISVAALGAHVFTPA